MLKRVYGAALLTPILSLACLGQSSSSNWGNVKAIAPGTQIRLVIGTAKPVMGSLESVTDTDFVLTQATGPQTYARPQITSIKVRKKDHRLRNALIGLGVGTAVGLAVGYGAGRAQSNCNGSLCGWQADGATVGGGIVGLVVGTLAGVFWPTGGWRKVYAP